MGTASFQSYSIEQAVTVSTLKGRGNKTQFLMKGVLKNLGTIFESNHDTETFYLFV